MRCLTLLSQKDKNFNFPEIHLDCYFYRSCLTYVLCLVNYYSVLLLFKRNCSKCDNLIKKQPKKKIQYQNDNNVFSDTSNLRFKSSIIYDLSDENFPLLSQIYGKPMNNNDF